MSETEVGNGGGSVLLSARLFVEVTEVDIADLYELYALYCADGWAPAMALAHGATAGCEAEDMDEVHDEYDEVEDKVEDSKVVTAPLVRCDCCC